MVSPLFIVTGVAKRGHRSKRNFGLESVIPILIVDVGENMS